LHIKEKTSLVLFGRLRYCLTQQMGKNRYCSHCVTKALCPEQAVMNT